MTGVAGVVYLVGAGPGDPGLITVRGLAKLRTAEVVVYDTLVNPDLLELAPPTAVRIDVGKKPGVAPVSQETITALLVEHAGRRGRCVVRLKGGDPFVFGRGGEEAAGLAAAGVRFEVIPGVTAAVGVCAYAGIPITHRGLTSTLALVTGHEDPGKELSHIDWSALARIGTLAFYMGVKNLPTIADRLLAAGMPASTPAAVICSGTLPTQLTVTGTLADIAARAADAGVRRPALTVVGAVVEKRSTVQWLEHRPFFGHTVVVTRRREQAGDLVESLAELGAEVLEAPVLEMSDPVDLAELDRAVRQAGRFDWLIFTSVNGVQGFFRRLDALELDVRTLGPARLAAIGPATASALRARHLRVDCVPAQFVAEEVFAALQEAGQVAGKRFLLPRADIARKDLPEQLRAAGAAEVACVDVYRTVPPSRLPALVATRLRTLAEAADPSPTQSPQALLSRPHWVTFTSSSTVSHFVALLTAELGPEVLASLRHRCRFAAIGPITARTASEHGLPLTVAADVHTIPGLVAAMLRAVGRS